MPDTSGLISLQASTNMKIKSAILAAMAFYFVGMSANAAVTYSFLSQGATFDGLTTANVSLTDGPTSFTMTVSSVGGNLNSNASGLGVDDANVDGTSESISISFSIDVEFNFMDLGEVGAGISDGASFTMNASTINLFTGATDFNGSNDVYAPGTPITLTAGNTIVLTGSSGTSSYDLDGISVTAVPEPSAAILGAFGALALLRRRHR